LLLSAVRAGDIDRPTAPGAGAQQHGVLQHMRAVSFDRRKMRGGGKEGPKRSVSVITHTHTHTHTHTFNGPFFPDYLGWAGTRKAKPIWILLKQETVSGSGISWAICKSASRSRQITMPTPHHSVFYRPDALPATEPTASKH